MVVLLSVNGCAPLPALESQEGSLIRSGSIDDARRSVRFHVLRAAYLPAGAELLGVEYSMRDAWVVQRYGWRDGTFYMKSEYLPPRFDPAVEMHVMIKGRYAPVSARFGVDGGVAEWLVYYARGRELHTVAGTIPAEQLVQIAAGSN